VRLRRREAQGQRDQIAAATAPILRGGILRYHRRRCARHRQFSLTIEGVVSEVIGRLKLKGLVIN
jgi:hypothetical protein